MKILPAKEVIICTEIKGATSNLGLVLSEDEKGKKPELGMVYAVGTGELPIPGIKKGSVIVYRRYTENKVFIESEEFNFIDFKDIVGVVEK